MTVSFFLSWWMLPAIVTLAGFLWVVRTHRRESRQFRGGWFDFSGLVTAFAVLVWLVIALLAWLIWALVWIV